MLRTQTNSKAAPSFKHTNNRRNKPLLVTCLAAMITLSMAVLLPSEESTHYISHGADDKAVTSNPISNIRINEVDSQPDDWFEIINTSGDPMDVSGFEIRDNADDHRVKLKDGTVLKGNDILLVDSSTALEVYDKHAKSFVDGTFADSFGLGKGDTIRLYDKDGKLLDSYKWESHAQKDGDPSKASYGRLPDGTGEFKVLMPTPGKPNKDLDATDKTDKNEEKPNKGDKGDVQDNKKPSDETTTGNNNGKNPSDKGDTKKDQSFPELPKLPWEGPATATVLDKTPTFLSDSSGLDYANGKLYAVDNGTAKVWVMNVNGDGTVEMVKGFEKGKQVRFQKDADSPKAKGPDAEGITVDGEGFVYIASERDNSNKKVNQNKILRVNINSPGESVVADTEWDITGALPKVGANMGIEAIEWVPYAVSGGIFFVGLEENGHIYAFVLNKDGTFVKINEFNSYLGGVMGLDYSLKDHTLRASADNGYGNVMSEIIFTGPASYGCSHYAPPKDLNVNGNYEGFALAAGAPIPDDKIAVYRFEDGVDKGALVLSWLTPKKDDNKGNSGKVDNGNKGSDNKGDKGTDDKGSALDKPHKGNGNGSSASDTSGNGSGNGGSSSKGNDNGTLTGDNSGKGNASHNITHNPGKVVNTGDTQSLTMWIIILGALVISVGALIVLKSIKNNKTK